MLYQNVNYTILNKLIPKFEAMKSYAILLLFMIVSSSFVHAQKIIIANERQEVKERYAGIKGNAFLFEEDVQADLYASDGSVEKSVSLNFNGYTGSFEYTGGEEPIILNEKIYKKVEILQPGNARLKFINTSHYTFKNEYVLVLAEGDELMFVRTCRIKKATVTHNKPGHTDIIEKFSPNFEYFVIDDGEKIKLKLKKKSIVEAFDKFEGFDEIVKKKKLKLNAEEDVILLVNWASNLNN